MRATGASSAYLNLFMFFMLTLVLAANYLLMFVGWEGVGLCSYLLIGFWFLKKTATDAGNKAFWVNRIGDFGFLLGLFLLFRQFGTLDFAPVFQQRGAPCRRKPAGTACSRRSRCCCWSAPPASRRSFRSTSGCPTRWKAPRRSAR